MSPQHNFTHGDNKLHLGSTPEVCPSHTTKADKILLEIIKKKEKKRYIKGLQTRKDDSGLYKN